MIIVTDTIRLASDASRIHNANAHPIGGTGESESIALTTQQRKWLLVAFKLLVIVALVWAIRGTLVEAFEQLKDHAWRLDIKWATLCGVLYFVGLLPSALYWFYLLDALGQKAGLLACMRAYLIGHLGKYVPGKALVVVLRVGLLRGAGVDPATAGLAVFLETLAMMSVGAGVAALILVVLFPGKTFFIALAAALFVAAGLPTIPPVARRLLTMFQIKKFQPEIVERLDDVKPVVFVAGWVGLAAGWFALGASLWACMKALGVETSLAAHLPLYTASVALAMVAGFLSLIPGGAGVRELVLTQLLTHAGIDAATALLTAVLLRVIWLLFELVFSGILYFCGPAPESPAPAAGE
ncbi:MAG: YbhN family protein [Pirellulales bacterium]|nr:YbhN family protein [Pirellulales bacterium]